MAFAATAPDHYRLDVALKPALRIAFAQVRVILFRETEKGIDVIRIRHQREDWRS
jgi:plasmid stabilization system protein ParE